MTRHLLHTLISLLLLSVSTKPAQAAHVFFRVDHICFMVEATVQREKIVVEYLQKLQGAQEASNTNMTVMLRQTSRTISAFTAKGREGQFSFQADEEGIYDICFARKRAGDLIELAVYIHVQFAESSDIHPDASALAHRKQVPVLNGKGSVDPSGKGLGNSKEVMEVMSFLDIDGEVKETLRSKEYINEIHENIRRVRGELVHAEAVTNHLLHRHGQFQRTTQSSYRRIWGFGLGTIALMAMFAYYQYYDMKSFLIKKKLV